ncbi:hypothetical protein PsYK624_115410 [Phanerochaete sordida]|uniref:F-box domain-containing protein n=1 Tax=Phanerochaete sordida TaxID=48140 RepID=A0A9P3GHX2_9APHY|nr:hypothetical protein PsYK624_115410 [Phanerochaete sordida]
MDALPVELVDLVIDKLRDDKLSLKICSLVCKTWLRQSSAHLFRSLRVNIWVSGCWPPRQKNLKITLDTESMAEVATIATQLPQLRSLSVRGTMMDPVTSRAPPPCSGRRLECLSVSDVHLDVIPYFLGLFASVGTLKISTCKAIHNEPAPLQHVYPVRCFYVRGYIQKGDFGHVIELLDPAVLESANLRISWPILPLSPADLNQLFRTARPALRDLTINIGDSGWHHGVADLSALQACTRLESLTIAFEWRLYFESDWWREMLAFLAVLPPHIRVVRIITRPVYGHPVSDIRNVLRAVEWRTVGSALEHCFGLECLRITVDEKDARPISAPEYRDLQEAILAALPSRLRCKTVFK